jgi:uncharacterized phage protein (TIGR01671 family)
MEREIKFSYIFQNVETGLICEKIYNIFEIENGAIKKFLDKNKKHILVARRQFIEEVDKNNKEIYEGDIFKIILGDLLFMLSEGNKGNSKIRYGVVKLLYGSYSLEFRNGDSELVHSPLRQFLKNGKEVIGNIYENPKLLNKE